MNEGMGYLGLLLSIVAFQIGTILKNKTRLAILNPLLVAILVVIAVLRAFDIDYQTYNSSARYLSYLLTPATICLAVLLYKQFTLLKQNWRAIMGGIIGGVIINLVAIWALCNWFDCTYEQYVTLLPKSITMAIGVGLAEQVGGIVPITVVAIIISGIFGNICGEFILKIAKITEPLAKGTALGTASHAIGTAKAVEWGTVEGAASSVALVLTGIMTVAGVVLLAK